MNWLIVVALVVCMVGAIRGIVGTVKSRLRLGVLGGLCKRSTDEYAVYLNELREIDARLPSGEKPSDEEGLALWEKQVNSCYKERMERMEEYAECQKAYMKELTELESKGWFELWESYKKMQ